MIATKMNPYAAAPEALKPWMALSDAVNDSLEHGSGEEYDMEDDVEPKSPGTPEHCDTTTSHAPSWLAESIEEFERAVE